MNTIANKESEITVKTVLAIRRKPGLVGLPGDDPTNYNLKVGSALKGDGPLRGLDREEEKKYLPIVTNTFPEDYQHWLESTKNYWSNISVPVPADEETPNNDNLKGKILKFTVVFRSKQIAEEYKVASLEKKASIVKKSGEVTEGISNYILFRYCLVYGRVANSFEDIGKSYKIRFYLYSKDQELKREHSIFKQRTNATRAFLEIMEDEKMINSVLRMFGVNPETFDSLGEKHLRLDKFKNEKPSKFLDFIKDKDLSIKASIKRAVELGVIYNPTNTESYYYGADNDVLIGASLLDAVLYLKSDDEKKKQVRDSIIAQIKKR